MPKGILGDLNVLYINYSTVSPHWLLCEIGVAAETGGLLKASAEQSRGFLQAESRLHHSPHAQAPGSLAVPVPTLARDLLVVHDGCLASAITPTPILCIREGKRKQNFSFKRGESSSHLFLSPLLFRTWLQGHVWLQGRMGRISCPAACRTIRNSSPTKEGERELCRVARSLHR